MKKSFSPAMKVCDQIPEHFANTVERMGYLQAEDLISLSFLAGSKGAGARCRDRGSGGGGRG
jgi:hypothetical protein